jgi:hypothetical protein
MEVEQDYKQEPSILVCCPKEQASHIVDSETIRFYMNVPDTIYMRPYTAQDIPSILKVLDRSSDSLICKINMDDGALIFGREGKCNYKTRYYIYDYDKEAKRFTTSVDDWTIVISSLQGTIRSICKHNETGRQYTISENIFAMEGGKMSASIDWDRYEIRYSNNAKRTFGISAYKRESYGYVLKKLQESNPTPLDSIHSNLTNDPAKAYHIIQRYFNAYIEACEQNIDCFSDMIREYLVNKQA